MQCLDHKPRNLEGWWSSPTPMDKSEWRNKRIITRWWNTMPFFFILFSLTSFLPAPTWHVLPIRPPISGSKFDPKWIGLEFLWMPGPLGPLYGIWGASASNCTPNSSLNYGLGLHSRAYSFLWCVWVICSVRVKLQTSWTQMQPLDPDEFSGVGARSHRM